MFKVFERLDRLEKDVRELQEVNDTLVEFVESDLATPWKETAEKLVQKIRVMKARRAAESRGAVR